MEKPANVELKEYRLQPKETRANKQGTEQEQIYACAQVQRHDSK